MKQFFVILFATILLSTLNAATYYVDQEKGNNNNSGTSQDAPWKTLSKVNSALLTAGDNVLLKSGQIWREQLNLTKSGTSGLPITIGAYGTGNKPVISGSDLLSSFVNYSSNVWKKALPNAPQQVFFNNIRGVEKTSISALTSEKTWFYDTSTEILYVYSSGSPTSIEASQRAYSVYVNGKYITISGLQVEKTSKDGILLTTSTEHVTVDNITLLQWTDLESCTNAGVSMAGKYNTVSNSSFGRSTGNDLADQKWAGFMPILVNGAHLTIFNNQMYHNSLENENTNGVYAFGIRVWTTSGILKIYGNHIYHIASSAIYMGSHTRAGDEVHIYQNKIEYPGQAGFSAYLTRGADGVGGKGYVYENEVSFANRLGGDVGAKGNQASGIHFNDGVKGNTDPNRPFIKWYCYGNIVHDNQAAKAANSPDANGISMDFNANNVEVYNNLIYNNNGKGTEMWNANYCKLYYNIIYGNDAGSTCSSAGGVETAANNHIYNNTYYKNYNGSSRGPNLNTEIWFGMNGKNLTMKNNIFYGAPEGSVFIFNPTNTSGHVVDNNIIYAQKTTYIKDGQYGDLTLAKWQQYRSWDKNSVYADPQFTNEAGRDFSLKVTSPAINKGVSVGLTKDFAGNPIVGLPDIGAREYATGGDVTSPEVESVQLLSEASVKITFSEPVNVTDLNNPANYAINNGIGIASISDDATGTSVILTTTTHKTGTYQLHAGESIKDRSGNKINTSKCAGYYSYCGPTVQLFPANNAIDLPLQFNLSWKKDLAATGYKLQVSKDQAFTTLVYNDTLLTDTVRAVSSLLASTKYYWRVKVRYNQLESAWSPVWNFTAAAPAPELVLVSPANNSVSQPVQLNLTWKKVVSATGYKLQVSKDAGFTTLVYNDTLLTDTLRTLSSLTSNTKYYWRIKARYNLSETNWSSANNFTTLVIVPAAVLISPANNAVNQPVQLNLTWRKDPSATGYKLQVAKDQAFTTLVYNDTLLTDTLRAVSSLLSNTKYYWRVKERYNLTEGNWSPVWNFTTTLVNTDPVPTTRTNVIVNAMGGTFSGGARLGSMTGMKSSRAVYFNGTNGGVTLNITVPKSGKWYLWARMYYMSSGGKNSFFATSNGTKYVLGDNDAKYNQWHWDGYKGAKIDLGTLSAGSNTVVLSGREPGTTLWIDQVMLTDDPTFIPADNNLYTSVKVSASSGTLSGDARLGSMSGMHSNRAVYFQGTNGGASINVNIPQSGKWYLWARMYYMSSGQKNSFFVSANSQKLVLGDDDTKYNKWHWDGYKGAKIDLGNLNAGTNTIVISGREPGLTLWVDEILLTQDASYNPNTSLAKEGSEEEYAAETELTVPQKYEMTQNYPNPFNPSTVIKYALPEQSHVTLKVYDILGSEVATLIDDVKAAGVYEVSFNAGNLASGVYVYQLRTNDFVQTRKMNLLK